MTNIKLKTSNKIANLFSKIYISLVILFVIDVIVGANGHYYEINVAGFVLVPRMILLALILLFFGIKFIFLSNREYKIKFLSCPIFVIMVLIFIYSLLSFILGIAYNGFGNAFYDEKSLLMIVGVFPIYDCFLDGSFTKKKAIRFFLILSLIIACFVFIFQVSTIVWGTLNKYSTDRIFHDLNIYFNDNYPNFAIGFRKPYGIYYDGLFYVSIAFGILVSQALLTKLSRKTMALKILGIIFFGFMVLQSQTRGFLLVMAASVISAYIIKLILSVRKKRKAKQKIFTKSTIIETILISLLVVSGCLIFFILFQNTRLFNLDDSSTAVRIAFINEALEVIFTPSILLGKGLGYFLPSKGSVHLEISLLEIILKQGLIGLLVWTLPIFYFFFLLRYSKNDINNKIFASNIIGFVYLVSLFNPHLNDVGGMMLLMVSLFFSYPTILLQKKAIEPSESKICLVSLTVSNNSKNKYSIENFLGKTLIKVFINNEYELFQISTYYDLASFLKEQNISHFALINHQKGTVENVRDLFEYLKTALPTSSQESNNYIIYNPSKGRNNLFDSYFSNCNITILSTALILNIENCFNYRKELNSPHDLVLYFSTSNILIRDGHLKDRSFASLFTETETNTQAYEYAFFDSIRYVFFYSFLNYFELLSKGARKLMLNNGKSKLKWLKIISSHKKYNRIIDSVHITNNQVYEESWLSLNL